MHVLRSLNAQSYEGPQYIDIIASESTKEFLVASLIPTALTTSVCIISDISIRTDRMHHHGAYIRDGKHCPESLLYHHDTQLIKMR